MTTNEDFIKLNQLYISDPIYGLVYASEFYYSLPEERQKLLKELIKKQTKHYEEFIVKQEEKESEKR